MQAVRAAANQRGGQRFGARLRVGLALALVVLVVGGCGSISRAPTVPAQPPPSSVILHGAGSDDAFPIYEEVGSELAPEGITLNYQLTTAPAAMARFRRGRLSFLSSASWRAAGNLPRIGDTSALYLPVGFSPVAVVYHLPSVHARLKLSGTTLAQIYFGRVRQWNNRAIARENPGLRLPATAISVVHRGAPAETTTLFTAYLAATSKRWRRQVGSGPAVNWPGGTAEDQDNAMEQTVGQTDGAIGYIDPPKTLASGLRAARLLNPARAFVAPTLRSTSAVGNGPRPAGSLSLDTINAPLAAAYPIVSETYVLVYRDLCEAGMEPREAAATQRFLHYLVGPGQTAVSQLAFAPLPAHLQIRAQAAVARLQCNAQPL